MTSPEPRISRGPMAILKVTQGRKRRPLVLRLTGGEANRRLLGSQRENISATAAGASTGRPLSSRCLSCV